MDDLQQPVENNRQEQRYCSFDTSHPTYQDFQIKIQELDDSDLLITIGTGGSYSWNVLTREDAIKLASAIWEVTK